jgi:PIN domain nuclease of toxin-antitoxin system
MSLLLDTHVVLWWLADDPGLAEDIKDLIHRDPFDRMLVAQAQCEGLTLVTRDGEIQKYDVSLLYV